MKHLKKFNTTTEYDQFKSGSEFVLPNVSFVVENTSVKFNPYVPDMRDNYLTIEALEDGLTARLGTGTCEYCIDGDGNWRSLPSNAMTVSINAGQTLSFRGNLTPESYKGIGTFTISKKCNLKGNCMSMLFGDDAAKNFSLEGKNYAFYGLFRYCTNIVTVSEGFLPATTLANGCYQSMFYGCTSLTTAPELPATTLKDYCYGTIFNGCSNLIIAPELPATTLAQECYSGMFKGCSSLTTAPELPATTLTNSCYNSMFQNCTSLTTAPSILPATTLTDWCYQYMFDGCTSLTTAPAISATTLASNCCKYMFQNCTSLTAAPELPATTLASWCYQNMFSDCTSLTTAPELPATTLAQECYVSMFTNCTSLTTAPELPATTLVSKCYQYMFQNCSNLNYIKMLATSTYPSATKLSDCLYKWVSGVSSTGTFVKNSAMTNLSTGVSGIPSGWTVEDAA